MLFAEPSLTYFASGSNHPGEILGFDDIGHPVGLTVSDASPLAFETVRAVGVPVFVDSGAFGEMAFGPSGPVVVREITDASWRDRLAAMLRIASRPQAGVSIVAPDRVGDQRETLARLARYKPELAMLASAGARVLVPVQRGPTPMETFWFEAQAVTTPIPVVPALPMKKNATTPLELARFAAKVAPADVHLLGMGPTSSRWRGAIDAFSFAGCQRVSSDSVLILANVGRTNGPGGGPRILTAAQDAARIEVEASIWSGGPCVDDYTDSIGSPDEWMTLDQQAAFRVAWGVDAGADIAEWLADDGDNGEPRALDPMIAAVLDAAWSDYYASMQTTAVKRLAIRRAFGARGT